MKPKKYEIKTIKELAELVTLKNAEYLAHDIRDFLLAVAEAKEIYGTEVSCERLVWIDDKKHNKTINIKVNIEQSEAELKSPTEE